MRKQLLITLCFLTFLGYFTKLSSQVVISEIISPNLVELQNQGTDTVDISTYWLCTVPAYEQVGALAIDVCGSFNLAPGEVIVMATTQINMTAAGAELALYSTNTFGDTSAILDFVIWGDASGTSREDVAVGAGIWTMGDRAPAYSDTTTLQYDGMGDMGSDYFVGQETSCSDNLPCQVSGGSIALASGATDTTICTLDGLSDFLDITITGATGGIQTWVVTDTNGVIRWIPGNGPLDLNIFTATTCLVWNLNYEEGVEGLELQGNTNLMGCFSFSNSIRVTKLNEPDCPDAPCEVDGGIIVTQDSSTSAIVCIDDDISDDIVVSQIGAIGTNSAWVVTDSNFTILMIDTSNVFNFDSAGTGQCLIWHLSYEDDLMGAVVDSNAANLSGCFDLSNPIFVSRVASDDCPPPPCDAAGGTIVTQDSLTSVSVCIDDEVSEDVVVTLSGAVGSNSAWVVTDTNLTILKIDTTNVFNFDSAGAGICLIWHLSFEDGLTGAVVDSNAANLAGCFGLSNPITVTRLTGDDCPAPPCEADGGTIVTQDSLTSVSVCIDDAVSDDVVVTLSGAVGSNSAWVVTDTNLTILKIDTTNVFNFDSAGAGICLIWHLSFEDDLTGAVVDSNAANLAGCFGLSNPITVTRLTGDDCPPPPCEADGGSIETGDGSTSVAVCIDDAMSEDVVVTLSGAVGSNSAWVVTDTNLTILKIDTTNVFNFDSAGAGICLIWHLSFEDDLTGAVVDSNAANLAGCFGLSNPITVTRLTGDDCPPPPCETDGGTIVTQDSLTSVSICIDDAVSEDVVVALSGAAGSNSAWVVTDTNLTILKIDTTNVFNFDSAGAGICLIWHLSFEDDLTGAVVDSNAANLAGCFDLSNPITVIRLTGDDCPPPPCEADGGTIVTQDSLTSVSICIDEAMSEDVVVTLSGAAGSNSAWVVTDTNLTILKIDTTNVFNFDSAGAGICLIWHLSFEDDLTGAVVDSNAANLAGCFDLSNPITVTRLTGDDCPPPPCEADGGTIVTQDSLTSVSICIDEAMSEDVVVTLSGAAGSNSAWVVTDTNLTILKIDTTNVFNFDSAGAGICLIWHLSFEDGLTGAVVDSNAANLAGCFGLSNPITVTRLTGDDCPPPPCEADGGSIATEDGLTSVSVCIDDAMSEDVVVTLSGAVGSNSAWVVTDTNLTILKIDTTNVFNFDSAGAGICLIWHLSFEDDLTGAVVDSNAANLAGCFGLSNPITVTRLTGDDCPPPPCQAAGGSIVTQDSTTSVSICIDDEVSEDVVVTLSGAVGSNSAWVVTDTNLTILKIDTTNVFNFDSSGAGVCLIWHLSYEDGLTGAELGESALDLDGCFSLSNPITVTRLTGDDCPPPPCEVEGGTLTLLDGETELRICVGDTISDAFDVSLEGASGPNTAWIITDIDGNVLALPTNPPFDLENAGVGVCQVWNISFEDGLTGLSFTGNVADIEGCFDLSNPITVTRVSGEDCNVEPCDVVAGMIMTQDSTTSVEVCIDDDLPEDIITSVNGATGTNNVWVVTDTALNILEIDTNNVFNFDAAGTGVCLIWHLTYSDSIGGAEVGANAADLTGCFGLSNPITVTRLAGEDCPDPGCQAQGGSLTTEDGETTIVICGGAGTMAAFDVIQEGASGSRSAWIITDADGVILGFPLSPPFNLTGASPGTYLVYHVRYEGSLSGASLGLNIADLDGCLSRSNPIEVIREDVTASSISFADGSESMDICVGDDTADIVDVVISGGEGSVTTLVVTTEDGTIIGLSDTTTVDVGSLDQEVCLVWAVNHDPSFDGLMIGANANDLMGCFVLSNALTVNKDIVDGGSLLTEIGASSYTICVGDDQEDVLPVFLTGALGLNSAYVITDTAGTILEVRNDIEKDFDSSEAGTCVVWHVSYSEIFGLEVDSSAADLTGCFALSNPFTVTKLTGDDCPPPCTAVGGTIGTADGADEITICVDDGVSDAFDLVVDGAEGTNMAILVLDADGNIIGKEDSFRADFEGAGEGQVFVRSISYDDDANVPDIGGNINALTGCFELSNVFTINRAIGGDCEGVCVAEGGTLVLSDESTSLEVCVDDLDEVPDLLIDGNAGDDGRFIIVGDNSEILVISETGMFDYSELADGTYEVWFVSYEDSLPSLEVGGSVRDFMGCFDLSNSIALTTFSGTDCPGVCSTDGGVLTLSDGSTEASFCAGEVMFTVEHQTSADTETTSYFYVVTDEEGEIISWRSSEEGGDFNLNTRPGGTCLIYGYSTDDPSLLEEDIFILNLLEGCGALSDPITITKEDDGPCVEGCHVPRDIRVQRAGPNRFQIRWDRVNEATGYVLRVGYQGIEGSFVELPVNRNRVTISGSPNRVIVIQIKSICGRNEESEFSGEIVLGAQGASSVVQSRNVVLRGKVLANGIVISEQAMAYPNPAIDQIVVWYDDEQIDGQLSVFDKMGRIVSTFRLAYGQEFHQIDVSELNEGMYFLTIDKEGIPVMQDKLIIVR